MDSAAFTAWPAVFTVSASVTIDAPASTVFDVLLDTQHYPLWNTFIPSVEIKKQPTAPAAGSHPSRMQLGTEMVFDARMKGSASSSSNKSTERVNVLDAASHTVGWIGIECGHDPGAYTLC